MIKALNSNGTLVCDHARDGQALKNNTLYLAPSDQHMLVVKGKILVTKGARENRSRPAIDPLFRSAAATYPLSPDIAAMAYPRRKRCPLPHSLEQFEVLLVEKILLISIEA